MEIRSSGPPTCSNKLSVEENVLPLPVLSLCMREYSYGPTIHFFNEFNMAQMRE